MFVALSLCTKYFFIVSVYVPQDALDVCQATEDDRRAVVEFYQDNPSLGIAFIVGTA